MVAQKLFCKFVLAIVCTTFVAASTGLLAQENPQSGQNEVTEKSNLIKRQIAPASEQFGMIPTDQAISQMKLRIEKNPNDYMSLSILGQLYLRDAKESDDHGSYVNAEQCFREAIRIAPSAKAAQVHLITALQSQHKFADALEQSAIALKTVPGNLVAIAAMGDAQLELGQIDEAAKSFSTVVNEIETPGVLARLARVAEMRGETEKAIELIAKAGQLSIELSEQSSTSSWYDFRLGYLHLGQGDLDKAQRAFETSISRDPAGTRSIDGLAKVYVAKSEFKMAEELYRKSLAIEQAPPTMADLGDLLEVQGKLEEAVQWFDRAEALMKEEAETTGVAHYRERALFLLGHDREFELALKLAAKDLENRQDVYSHDTYAWALMKNARFEEAFTVSSKALTAGVEDAELYFRMGMVAAKANQTTEANSRLKKCLSINPTFNHSDAATARKLLAEIGEVVNTQLP